MLSGESLFICKHGALVHIAISLSSRRTYPSLVSLTLHQSIDTSLSMMQGTANPSILEPGSKPNVTSTCASSGSSSTGDRNPALFHQTITNLHIIHTTPNIHTSAPLPTVLYGVEIPPHVLPRYVRVITSNFPALAVAVPGAAAVCRDGCGAKGLERREGCWVNVGAEQGASK